MSAENKHISGRPNVLDTINKLKTVQIGVVVNVDDPASMGRIKAKIPGSSIKGGDDDTPIDQLPWCYPMVPKFFSSIPKVGEGIFIITFNNEKTHSDRLYLGPIISQLNNLNVDPVSTTALSPFTFAFLAPNVNVNNIPVLNGVFPAVDDIAIQGRYNTDILLRTDEVLIRAGKFVISEPNANNPYSFQFNNSTQGYFHVRNNVTLSLPTDSTIQKGSVINLVGNKINLLTHADGTPRFDLLNQDNQISDDEILKILQTAHPLPFGDLLIQYLKLFKTAFLNHVHNNNGLPPTDLVSGGNVQSVKDFKTKSDNLENSMLSKNIRIN